ncbi:tripartite tricarboxylate transporter substrate binding protein [Corticibacterium sp. UT-5YL-CI-8]|nr:tripartite tricarboxylate transporter substrate binding protein [Tianweitania sp. UT-5YL-CI-8]
MAPFLSKKFGQPVLVENRPGGNGTIAHEAVLRADPDGHAATFSNTSLIVAAPHVFSDIQVDPVKSFTHVTMVAEGRHVMLSNPSLQGKSLAEIVQMSKDKPGTMIHASTGAGSTNSVAFELFQMRTGANFTTAQYKGTGPIMTDMLADQVHLTIAAESSAEPFITSGRLGAVMIMAKERVSHLPDLPSSAELGVADLDRITFWNGIHVSAATPADVVKMWRDTIAEVLTDKELAEKMAALRLTTVGDTTEHFTDRVQHDYAFYGELFKAANIKPE